MILVYIISLCTSYIILMTDDMTNDNYNSNPSESLSTHLQLYMKVTCTFIKDVLKGDGTNEIRLELKEVCSIDL